MNGTKKPNRKMVVLFRNALLVLVIKNDIFILQVIDRKVGFLQKLPCFHVKKIKKRSYTFISAHK
jgi:hypothetical protein